MITFKTVTTQKITTVVCDGCGLQASADGDYEFHEFHEFISIKHHCGYSSIHGDGKQIDVDLCQQCFADMCGDTLRVMDKSNNIAEDNENSKRNQLEYSNIFDVICQSKSRSHQLKENCDLRLAARDILLKNKVADNNKLAVALKRVEQLWDAQYHSAEGNELHQLADLICAYEKKDWNSFLEDVPLADDNLKLIPVSQALKVGSVLTQEEQKQFILNFILDWTGSKEAALKWYESEVIPALNKTAQETVDNGGFEAVKEYLEHIEQGGFA